MKRINIKRNLVLLVVSVLLLGGIAQGDFIFTDFSSVSDLNLLGDAAQVSNRLCLVPATDAQIGGAWHNTQQTVENGFDTTFDFQISNVGGSPPEGGDGFAFLVQNDNSSALSGAGGGTIGYGLESGGPGILNSVAVEFDIHENFGWPDLTADHVSVNTRGLLANSADQTHSLGSTTVSPINNGSVHTARISYSASEAKMRVYIDNLATPVLTIDSLDLASTLNLNDGKAWVGFTAATGAAHGDHDILNWSFIPEPVTLLVLGIGALGLLLGHRRRQYA